MWSVEPLGKSTSYPPAGSVDNRSISTLNSVAGLTRSTAFSIWSVAVLTEPVIIGSTNVPPMMYLCGFCDMLPVDWSSDCRVS